MNAVEEEKKTEKPNVPEKKTRTQTIHDIFKIDEDELMEMI